jgi:hypothetical protein
MGAVAKSYMMKGFLIYEEMRKHLVIYKEEAVSHTYMTFQPLPSGLPYIWGKFSFLFYQFSEHNTVINKNEMHYSFALVSGAGMWKECEYCRK